MRETVARCDSLINSQTTILNEFQQEIRYLKQSKPSSLILIDSAEEAEEIKHKLKRLENKMK